MSIAARGAPAVPEVKSSTATSASSRSTSAAIGSPAASSTHRDRARQVEQARRCPRRRAARRAPTRAACAASTDAGDVGFSGTATAPAQSAPRYAVTKPTSLWQAIATRSPGATPRPAMAARRPGGEGLELGERDHPIPLDEGHRVGVGVGVLEEQDTKFTAGFSQPRRLFAGSHVP